MKARRFNSAALALGEDFSVNETFKPVWSWPASWRSVAKHPEGRFVVAWRESDIYGPIESAFRGRVFDPEGVPVTGDLDLGATSADNRNLGAVAADALGRFLLVWANWAEYNLYGQLFSFDGIALGSRFQIASGEQAPENGTTRGRGKPPPPED
jgi:hypothetical protein